MEVGLALRAYGARFLAQLPGFSTFKTSVRPKAFWAAMIGRHIWHGNNSVSHGPPQLHAFGFGRWRFHTSNDAPITKCPQSVAFGHGQAARRERPLLSIFRQKQPDRYRPEAARQISAQATRRQSGFWPVIQRPWYLTKPDGRTPP